MTASLPATARAMCFPDVSSPGTLHMATVQVSKARFVAGEDKQGCPGDMRSCQEKPYLVSGDTVLTGATKGAFTCTGFISPTGKTWREWLPTEALKPASADEESPTDWAGDWTAESAEISIKPNGATFTINGNASFGNGASTNMGDFTATAAPDSGMIAFTEGNNGQTLAYGAGDQSACRIRMVLKGPYLIASDNNNCGGLNVTFSGYYRRTAGKH
ncbi:hypothetical protein [Acetobacter conturbans]|uniref:Uncharacterized protein n=1 Tax=Acetobacter conturbans TaxID=1737472 RepID=A0ABX0K0K5_9PROT|nr:hypothetical protein [Acetobacter conturbans]NHN89138.1 hypothetical protein [Acetobacter conturbans]